jgi:hypothetical protein
MADTNLGEIFRLHGGEYLEQFGSRMLPGHIKALYDIAQCRTEAAGGHIVACDKCGYEHYIYHSCCNRSCPQCHITDAEEWLAKRESELLAVPYFHLVFTVPQQLRPIIRSNQKALYDVLMKAAVDSLKKLTLDPRYLGGKVGILAVLHTWGRTLGYHPHIHCLVPGVGISEDKQYLHFPKKSYLVPKKALSIIFKAKFTEMSEVVLPQIIFPSKIPAKWVVFVKDTPNYAEKVLQYLSRYVHRTAITNNRILSHDNGTVTFKFKPVDKKEWEIMPLPVLEFIRRILQHTLPKGFHKVRYYGFLAPSNRQLLVRINNFLQLKTHQNEREHPVQPDQPESVSGPGDSREDKKNTYPKCPRCKNGNMIPTNCFIKKYYPFCGRSPP